MIATRRHLREDDGYGIIERLFRLRYTGSATTWGFAIYLHSKEGYED